jgi:hypothetical protein
LLPSHSCAPQIKKKIASPKLIAKIGAHFSTSSNTCGLPYLSSFVDGHLNGILGRVLLRSHDRHFQDTYLNDV